MLEQALPISVVSPVEGAGAGRGERPIPLLARVRGKAAPFPTFVRHSLLSRSPLRSRQLFRCSQLIALSDICL